MELVERHLPDPLTPPGPLSGTLPPFTDPEDTWGHNELFDFDYSSPNQESTFQWEEDCDCGGPPPPAFNLPPPPPPSIPAEEDSSEGSGDIPFVGAKNKMEGFIPKKTESNSEVSWATSTSKKHHKEGNCEDTSPSPQDACPALLIAGDAHVRPRLHPPIAALLVAAATFAFVIGIAAVVCWRFRKQRNRLGSTKSTSDLTNGVIYDDLPSGPTPRVLTSHGHETCTLAPMELLDLKLASQLHSSSFVSSDRGPPQLLLHSNSTVHRPQTLSHPPANHSLSSGPISSADHISTFRSSFPNPYGVITPPQTLRKNFSFGLQSPQQTIRNCDFIYSEQNPLTLGDPSFIPKDFKELVRVDSSGNTGKRMPFRSSQELYNPTYEEISTGSECTSVSSESSHKRPSLPTTPKGVTNPGDNNGPWSPVPCPCGVKGPTSSRRDSRLRKQKNSPPSSQGNPFTHKDFHENSQSLVYGIAPPIPPPTLYTIPGTSDGRTSTSSSSDQPAERGREARYYVGGQFPPSIKSPGTSPEGYASPYVPPPSVQEGLPPLPSRSDRYRIYFTSDRKKGMSTSLKGDSKTLDLTSRKRNRTKDFSSQNENEPLYHEL